MSGVPVIHTISHQTPGPCFIKGEHPFEDCQERAANQFSATAPSVDAAKQVGGDHYKTLGIEPFAVIDSWGLDFYTGNALKYIARSGGAKGRKSAADAAEDLLKAAHYLEEAARRRKEINGD